MKKFFKNHLYSTQSRQSDKLFLKSRNWVSPNPSPTGECAPPPRSGGRGTHPHSLTRVGLGEFQFRRGDIHCGTLCIYALCDTVHPGRICTITAIISSKDMHPHSSKLCNCEKICSYGPLFINFLPFFEMFQLNNTSNHRWRWRPLRML